jgi:putative membrane-bound dehydrogenase-like protein
MRRAVALAVVLSSVVHVAHAEVRTPAPLPAEQAAREMKLPEGFRATVFAAEPDVIQPISFCFDDRGRIYVAEALNYGNWQATGKDRITILEDTDGDGKADKRTVFYEGFNYITGIEYGFGGVWVMSPPCLYFVPDRNGDDKPDGKPEVLFDGFGYQESRHNLANGFTWGPDGWLYAGHGRTSPSDVGPPGTPKEKRVHCDGGVYRIHPVRKVFEVFADGTTNPWGVDFDDYGQCFVSNCVNPHLFHMIQGGHYEPWRNRPSSQYAYERLPTIADHLHYPGSDLRAVLGTPDTLAMGGGHAHCGTLVYLGDSFPADYRNTVLMCNVHGHRVNRDILKRVGSGYTASHGKDFAISTDPWFMGVTLKTGPDGSVFVSDWSDTGECHTYKPDMRTGRIYKISYGKPDRDNVDLAKKSNVELANLQSHRNDWYVQHARRLLQERAAALTWEPGATTFAKVRARLDDRQADVPSRLRMLWALWVTGNIHGPELTALMSDRSEHLRAWAIRLFCERLLSPGTVERFAGRALSDPSPVVRLNLTSALHHLAYEDRWTIAEGLLSHEEDATDANLPLMIWYGVEPLVPDNPARALKLAVNAKIPKVRQFVARRLVEHVGDKGDLKPWVEALAASNDAVRRDLLQGARAGALGRKRLPMPAGWSELYPQLEKNEDARVLALIFGDPRALAELRKTVETRTTPATARRAALEGLVDHHAPDLAPLLQDLLADKDLRRTALRGLAAYPDEKTPKLILARYPELSPDERADAVATLAARTDTALVLLDAVENKAIPRSDVSAFAARAMYARNDPTLTARLKAVWGEVRDTAPQKQEQLAKYKAQLTPTTLKAANLKNGKALYAKTCQACHKLYGEGTAIGPDLTGSNRNDLDYLLSNLIDPSAEVAKDYRMSAVQTLDGRLITGIIVERSAARVVVQTATEKVTLAAEDVDTVKDSALSIMPDGQLDALTRNDVRDLIGYLMKK